jgi:hypothetical protein
MKSHRVSFIVYLIAALVLGFTIFRSMMWGVWGAPVSPLHYLALLGSVVLFFGAFICLVNHFSGRIVCGIALCLLGTFYVPATVSIVPAHNEILSPIVFLILLAYFSALAFVLFFPTRWKFSVPFYLITLGIAGALAAGTFIQRTAKGEYARPAFAFFVWKPGESVLQVQNDNDHWITTETKSLLEQNGIRGSLEWAGSSGYGTEKIRVIILAQRQITLIKQIPYPRRGTVVYAFDGTNWKTLPQNAPTYSTFATLEPQGSNTMLKEQLANGGIQGSGAFFWK